MESVVVRVNQSTRENMYDANDLSHLILSFSQCESLLPCSVFQCHNEGICKDEYDSSAGTYTAK